jgi:hypothetical protein
MATLSRRARTLRNQSQPHANVATIRNSHKGFRLTGGNTRQILAQLTGDDIRENYRRTVPLIKHNGSMGTGLGTIAASGTAFKKKRLRNCSRRPEPISPNRRRSLLARRVFMFNKLMGGLGH